jgi:hypothetical protein
VLAIRKETVRFHHIPTPRWDYLYDRGAFDENFPLPAIVKPANSDSSLDHQRRRDSRQP